MDINKNDCFTVHITDMRKDGDGIGKTDGYTWFVKDAVKGDFIEAKATKLKSSYGYARLMKIIDPSPERVECACPVATRCGGCQLQALSYRGQLEFKHDQIVSAIERIGGLDADIPPLIGMEDPWRYRNKAQFPVGTDKDGRIVTGFYAKRTHDIIDNDDCLLGPEENSDILNTIKLYMYDNSIQPYDERNHSGIIRHILIRKAFFTGQIMVCIVINSRHLPHSDDLVKRLDKIDGMSSISYCVNMKDTNVILTDQITDIYGPGYIIDRIGDVEYRISAQSFYQVNPVQTKKLYETVLEFASLTGEETVWDLYCGIGTISLFLAKRAKEVYGVEIVPRAVRDATENAALNNITNVHFFAGKAEEVLPEEFKNGGTHADVIVVDPPRKGCDERCLDTIAAMAPKRVVYVSCDPATLARDLRYLCDRGYILDKVQGFDMFPFTCHTESVSLLIKA